MSLDSSRRNLKATYRFAQRTVRFATAAAREAKGADLVVCHDTSSAIPALWAARASRARLALDVSEIPDLRERTTDHYRRLPAALLALLHAADRHAGRNACVVTTSSPRFREYTEQRYGRPALQVTHYDPAAPASGRTPVPGRIIWPSTFSRATGAAFALEAIAQAPAGWELVVVGDDADAGADAALAAQLAGAGSRVRFVPRSDYDAYMAGLASGQVGWVLFAPTRANLRLCLPNRFQDLLAAGVPVVATPNESLMPLLADGRWGQCVPHGDVPALLAATARLADRPFSPPPAAQLQAALGATDFEHAYAPLALPPAAVPGERPLAAIVAMRSLAGRRRITALAYALVRLGWQVVVIARQHGPDFDAARAESRHIRVCALAP